MWSLLNQHLNLINLSIKHFTGHKTLISFNKFHPLMMMAFIAGYSSFLASPKKIDVGYSR